ncbi:MAG: HAMP domain-containing histidine kinase [Polyangiaceae bacterium]|nr:HAMP domain-containing histidine kinase [Polyangiaceae bacterium]
MRPRRAPWSREERELRRKRGPFDHPFHHPHDFDRVPPWRWHEMPRSFWVRIQEQRRLRRKIFFWFGIAISLTFGIVYWSHHYFSEGLRWKVSAGLGLLTLWAVSGKIARHLARPFDELARAAEALGHGDLGARVDLHQARHAEARVLGETFNDMAARIEKQLRDQRALLAMVSHELRTPLSRIRLLTEMSQTDQEEKRQKALSEIDEEVSALDALVSDLLASSRIDFSSGDRVVLRATEVATRAVETARVDPTVLDVESPALAFEGDATLAVRALVNLLENAVRHGGKVVALRVYAHDGAVVFEVDDDGPGFAPGEEQKLFDAFYKRPATDGARERSVGLGLTLVRRIAEAHGGRAYAEARRGGGARFGITFPAAPVA